jgi:ribosomal protein S18 acetylase RimI-like enzyme
VEKNYTKTKEFALIVVGIVVMMIQNKDNVSIKASSVKDIPIILGLLYELGRPKPQKDSDVETFQKLVRKYVKDSDKTILVAELDDMRIVGMVSVMYLPRLNQPTLEMYIPELVVLAKYQGQGIGKN